MVTPALPGFDGSDLIDDVSIDAYARHVRRRIQRESGQSVVGNTEFSQRGGKAVHARQFDEPGDEALAVTVWASLICAVSVLGGSSGVAQRSFH